MKYFILSDYEKPFAILKAKELNSLSEKIFNAFKEEIAEEIKCLNIDYKQNNSIADNGNMYIEIKYINEEGKADSMELYLTPSAIY